MSTPLDEVDTQTDYETILRAQIREGLRELRRPPKGLFLSALSCGLNLSFGVFGLLVIATMAGGTLSPFVTQGLKGVVYTFGFVFAILGQTELFTEHTSLALFPVLDGQASWRELGRLWTLVWSGNLLGSGLFAVIAFFAGPWLHLIDPYIFVKVASTFIKLPPQGVFVGAVLAGWLMALLAWILTSVSDTISRVVVIMLVTFLIGFGHLPHCVAANTEVIAGILAGADITWLQGLRFQALTTLGNIVGGVVFIGLLNYSHAIRGSEEIEAEI
jgi:formate/nitrite transporter FocA (FNT family)